MTSADGDHRPPVRVVLADANVLYSRVLRDYLLYAATQGALEIRWSAPILAEVVEHLTAVALSVDADVLCTGNLKDFPAEVMDVVGIQAMSADELLSLLVTEFPNDVLAAHRLAVSRFPGASDMSTIEALRRAGASSTADRLAEILGI